MLLISSKSNILTAWKGGNHMATQSIFNNIFIQDSKSAEAFVNALENAVIASEKVPPKKVSSRDLSKDEIKKFFGVETGVNTNG
jgi:hypothetical protein